MNRCRDLDADIGIAVNLDTKPIEVAIAADGQLWHSIAESREQAYAISVAAIRGILRTRRLRALKPISGSK